MPAHSRDKPRSGRAGALHLALFRHGPAAERNAALYPDDDLRPLTPSGRKRVKASGRALRKAGFIPESIHFSPSLRARETAEILAVVFRLPKASMRVEPALHGDADPAVIARKTQRMRPDARAAERILWVGHEPGLGEAIGVLTDGPALPLRKAGVALLELPRESSRGARATRATTRATLKAFMPPDWLAALA